MMNICIIGLGQIGLPVAHYIHNRGFNVCGYDINTQIVEKINKENTFKATTSWRETAPADVYIICVSTGLADGHPDVTPVFEVCKKISQKASSKTIVSIESTILPGTSRRIFQEIFNSKALFVHAPHRFWADEPEKFGVNQVRVLGAINKESLDSGLHFYKDDLGIPIHICSSIEIAEMCKITENSHRYLQIAFAEDLRMMCANIGINFEELRIACNTKWNVDIPEARAGIGRHCLPKDIQYVTFMAPSVLLSSALLVDKKYREWLAKQ